jgi:hypothetical protein
VKDLARKLMRYIREYNKAPKTVKWKYFDPSRRITTESVVTGHLVLLRQFGERLVAADHLQRQ